MKNNSSYSTGLGTLGVLQIIFIVLKLIGTINWSWWVVLVPLWINLGCAIIFLILLGICNKF